MDTRCTRRHPTKLTVQVTQLSTGASQPESGTPRNPAAHFHRHSNQHPIKHVNHQTNAHCFCHSDALCNACSKSMQSPSPTSRAYQWVRRQLPPSDTLSATRRCQGLLRHCKRFGGVGILGHGPWGYCVYILTTPKPMPQNGAALDGVWACRFCKRFFKPKNHKSMLL